MSFFDYFTGKKPTLTSTCICPERNIYEMYEANGETFVGKYENGQFVGKCTKVLSNGDAIKGNYENGQFVGAFTKECFNGDTYIAGSLIDGKIDGPCNFTRSDGMQIAGNCTKDRFNGQVIITYPDGSILEGELRNGHFISRALYTKTLTNGVKIVYCYPKDSEITTCSVINATGDELRGHFNVVTQKMCGEFTVNCVDGGIIKGIYPDTGRLSMQVKRYVNQPGREPIYGEIRDDFEFVPITAPGSGQFRSLARVSAPVAPVVTPKTVTISIKCPACNKCNKFNLADQTSYDESTLTCIVCLDKPANVYFPTCKHMNSCAECVAKLKPVMQT